MPANIRCFVAMAFDRPDTDAMFAVIRRTLKPLGIVPRRVDRIEHNDNIDQKIISELAEADLVIADLTYARPSVYFEAGYAQRQTPVVYTARRDHFREKDDDPNGNLQVHFDLKMRNIVGWSTPTDLTFPKRLTSRITKVIAPRIKQKQVQLEQKKRLDDFDRLSLHDKRVMLVDGAFNHFHRLRYTIRNAGRPRSDDDSRTPVTSPSQLRAPGFTAVKTIGKTFTFVAFQVEPNITVKLAERYNILLTFPVYDYKEPFQSDKALSRIGEHIITCSFGTDGLRRLSKAIPQLRAGKLQGTLQCELPYDPSRYKQPRAVVPRQVTFHVFESSARLVDLENTLDRRFKSR
jgi:nucleoside 2-deoxyribosyltransferase